MIQNKEVMETKFNSQRCTTREQSERLLSMGLKPETADMVWKYRLSRAAGCRFELLAHSPVLRSNCHFNIDKINVFGHKRPDGSIMSGDEYFDELFGKDIPAWSLHRLIELIYGEGYHAALMNLEVNRPYEDCIERIENLIEGGRFNKNYLV